MPVGGCWHCGSHEHDTGDHPGLRKELRAYNVRCERTLDYPEWEDVQAWSPEDAAKDHVEAYEELTGEHDTLEEEFEVEVEGHGTFLVKSTVAHTYFYEAKLK